MSPVGLEISSVKALVEKELEGKYFYLIPRKNIIFYPKQRIEEKLFEIFPRINSLSINLKKASFLEITLALRKPISLWCKDTKNEKCYFLDEKGFIFDEAGNFSDGIYFIYRGEVADSPLGSMYIEEEKFALLRSFIADIRDLGFFPQEISPIGAGSYDLTVSGGHILFSIEDNSADVLTNLSSLLGDARLSILKGSELQVESVDLRYGKKIIFKKKNSL